MKEAVIERHETLIQGRAIYASKLWLEDLDRVLDVLPEIKELAGQSVLVTGAAGLVCSAVMDLMLRYNETHSVPIKVLAAGRSQEEMEARFGSFCTKPYFTFVPYDAARGDNDIAPSADYVIHGASNAYPAAIMKEPVETMLSNFTGLLQLLQYAKEWKSKRVLCISSSEVYGCREGNEPYKEDEYGWIDLLSPRSSYPMGKRAAETLCASYAAEYGVDVVIARPGNIYGPTATTLDTRVSSAWAYAAARSQDIIMKSDGSQLRSYCHCLDCASALLKVLLRGSNGRAYNIANPDTAITIRQMAQLLAQAGNVALLQEQAAVAEGAIFNPMRNSSLDSSSLEALGWKSCFDARTGFGHTVEILREMLAAEPD